MVKKNIVMVVLVLIIGQPVQALPGAVSKALAYMPAVISSYGIVKLVRGIRAIENLALTDQSAHQEKIAVLQEMVAKHTDKKVRIVMVSDSDMNKQGVALAMAFYSITNREHLIFFSIDLYEQAMHIGNRSLIEFFIAHELNHIKNYDVFVSSGLLVLTPVMTLLATYYAPDEWQLKAGGITNGLLAIGLLWYRHNAEKRADNQVANDPALLQAGRDAFARLYAYQKQQNPAITDGDLWLQSFVRGHVDHKIRIDLLDARIAQLSVAA